MSGYLIRFVEEETRKKDEQFMKKINQNFMPLYFRFSGNSFYAALSFKVHHNEYAHWRARRELKQHLLENRDEYEKFLLAHTLFEDLDTMIQNVGDENEDGQILAIEAASRFYKINIVVYYPDWSKTIYPLGTDQIEIKDSTLYIARRYWNYYQCMVLPLKPTDPLP